MTRYNGKNICIESYSVTTDSVGAFSVTLSHTPVDDGAVMIFCFNSNIEVEYVSRSVATLSLKLFTSAYDKLTTVSTTLETLPSGVSQQSGSSTSTSSETAIAGGWAGGSAVVTHSHTLNQIFSHGHTLTQTSTAVGQNYLNVQTKTIVIIYAW